MYTVNLKTSSQPEMFMSDGGASEYYIKLIVKEISECLNSNGISYHLNTAENPENYKDNKKLANIEIKMSSSPGALPGDESGVYIFFDSGNPESKRIADIFENNIKKVYHTPENVKLISKNNGENQSLPSIMISIGYADSPMDVSWLKDNIELISKVAVASLCEYFEIPFIGCEKFYIGTVNIDSSVYDKPTLNSKIIGSAEKNSKVKVLGQWENWYVIGKNHKLGYIQTQFVNI